MIRRWSEGVADANMAEDILIELGTLIGRHPWWKARSKLTLALLVKLGIEPPAQVLDAGCGWGTTLEALEKAGYRVTGADISRRALERLDRTDRELVEVDLTKPLVSEAINRYDAVLALDVIEHIDDDREAVRRLGSMVRPGGSLIISVPANPDLFSEFDAIQGHRRRYLPDTLKSAFQFADLNVESIFWWGAWMLPIFRLTRGKPRGNASASPAEIYRQYLSLPPWPATIAISIAHAIEQPRALAGKLHQGTSLFAVARKPVQTAESHQENT